MDLDLELNLTLPGFVFEGAPVFEQVRRPTTEPTLIIIINFIILITIYQVQSY